MMAQPKIKCDATCTQENDRITWNVGFTIELPTFQPNFNQNRVMHNFPVQRDEPVVSALVQPVQRDEPVVPALVQPVQRDEPVVPAVVQQNQPDESERQDQPDEPDQPIVVVLPSPSPPIECLTNQKT